MQDYSDLEMKIRRFGENLAAAREKAGMTQHELARKIGKENGQTISNWETGKSPPKSLADAIKLCEIFQCDLDYLIGRLPEQTHDIQFIHDQTGLTGDAVKKLQGNPGLMFVLSLLIEQKDFDLWLKRVSDYLNKRLTNHRFPPQTKEDIEDESDELDEKQFYIFKSLINILETIPIEEYDDRLNEALKKYHWKEAEIPE